MPSNSGCNAAGTSCSESDVRLGINGHFHFSPRGPLDPWIGIGAAYEWLNASVSGTGAQPSTGFISVRGCEFVNAQLGLDVKLVDAVYMGPFVAFSTSQYSTAEVGSGSVSISADVQNKAIHDWLIFGLRGQFNVNFK